jgi:hypothetical protein
MTDDEIRELAFDAQDATTVAEMAAIVTLAESGDGTAWTRLSTLRHGRPLSRTGPHGLSKRDADRLSELVATRMT